MSVKAWTCRLQTYKPTRPRWNCNNEPHLLLCLWNANKCVEYYNQWHNTLIFLNSCQHIGNFKPQQLPSAIWQHCFRIFFLKNIIIFSIGNACQPTEPALCQLYRHSFVPYSAVACSCDVGACSWSRSHDTTALLATPMLMHDVRRPTGPRTHRGSYIASSIRYVHV